MTQILTHAVERVSRTDGFMADVLTAAMVVMAGFLTLTFFAAV